MKRGPDACSVKGCRKEWCISYNGELLCETHYVEREDARAKEAKEGKVGSCPK